MKTNNLTLGIIETPIRNKQLKYLKGKKDEFN